MKRVVRSLLLFFCTTLFMLSAIVCVCVVPVHADGATYSRLEKGVFTTVLKRLSDNKVNKIKQNGYDDVRCVYAISSRNRISFYFVCIYDSNIGSYTVNAMRTASNGSIWVDEDTNTNYTMSYGGTGNGYTVDGVLYWVYNIEIAGVSSDYEVIDIPRISTDNYVTAIEYTFGSHAVDPSEPVSWGQVNVEGYQTNIAGQGQAAIHNVDVITWDNSIDTNGNDITDGNVRIRIIPGEYRGSSKDDLLSKKNNDFILDIQHATAGNVVPVTAGSISYKWSDVIDALNFSSMSIFNTLHDNDTWFKRGWIYEIRLEIDDYISEWQTIYASTSSGVENDLTIVNTSVITQNTITAIQEINSINSTTNIWIVNGQPVDPNPEQTPPESEDEKPWWVYLLEMINNTLGIQNEYINEGTNESIEVVNNFEDDHTELNTTVNNYDDIENDLVLDMNNNLEQIEVESDLTENNSFLSSARWVAEQYTTIVTDNPIGSILKFSLVLGFVMIFLGRFK